MVDMPEGLYQLCQCFRIFDRPTFCSTLHTITHLSLFDMKAKRNIINFNCYQKHLTCVCSTMMLLCPKWGLYSSYIKYLGVSHQRFINTRYREPHQPIRGQHAIARINLERESYTTQNHVAFKGWLGRLSFKLSS